MRDMAQSMMLIEKSSHCASWYDIDTGELQGRLSLPDYPHEFVVDKEFQYAYVGHYGVQNSSIDGTEGNSVIVINIRTQKVAHTFNLGIHSRPHGIELDQSGRLYVLSEWTNNLLVKQNPRAYATGFDYITPTGGQKSHLFALQKDGEKAYSMNLVSNDVTVFHPYDSSISPISIKTGEKPEGRCLRADEKILFTTNRISNTVTVIDTQSLEIIQKFDTPNDPCRIFHDSKRGRLVTMNHFGGSFSIFDDKTGEELYRHETPANPLALTFDAEQDYAYIAIDCEQVLRFDLENFKVVQTFNTLLEPDVMYILPDGFSRYWEGLDDE